MTQDTQAGAGAQPAPAIQPEALRIAMHLRQRAQLSRPGNLDTLSASGANELERQHAELSAAQSEAKHWRTNHDNVVSRLRIFTQRPDIPKELADRLPWYRELVRLQTVAGQAAAKDLHQSAEAAAITALNGLLSLVRREAPQLSGKVLGDAESAIAALQAAPPAPAAVTVSDEDAMFEAWVRTHEDAHGAFDDWSARAGWEASAALAAAPAQAWPSECDSPELCRVHRGCAGQYGTKKTCHSFAVLNPCNSAAPAQEHATELAGQGLEQDVRNALAMLKTGQWAEHFAKTDLGKQLEDEITELHSELNEATQAQNDARDHTAELCDLLNRRPAMNAGLDAEYAAWSDECYRVMGALSQAAANDDQAQEDACPVLDDEWKRRMLDGRPLVRDEMGCGYHPALPTLDEGMNPKQFFEALGIQLAGSMADGEMDMDAYDAMVEATDYNVWTPGAPDGEGWALVAIFDTEDGPAAWWIRAAEPKQPALPSWWPEFIQSVAELPDRSSPEDEPDAMVATADELGNCAINAIDAARAAQGGAA